MGGSVAQEEVAKAPPNALPPGQFYSLQALDEEGAKVVLNIKNITTNLAHPFP